jgi:uncharacterized membrane protein YhiD involved in acid resistance
VKVHMHDEHALRVLGTPSRVQGWFSAANILPNSLVGLMISCGCIRVALYVTGVVAVAIFVAQESELVVTKAGHDRGKGKSLSQSVGNDQV